MNFANGAQSRLSAGITAGATSLTVASAAAFPAAPFHIVIGNELMTVTAVASNTFTVTRGIEGTTAVAHGAGSIVTNCCTAGDLNGFAGGTASPLTTKGDLWGFSSTNARVPVGANGFILVADSTQALGLRWEAPLNTALPTVIQGALAAGSGTPTATATMPLAPTQGNTLVCMLATSLRGANSITQIGVTWTKALTNNAFNQYCEIWLGAVGAGAGTGVTINFTGNSTQHAIINEIAASLTTATLQTTDSGTTARGQNGPQSIAAGTWWVGIVTVSGGTFTNFTSAMIPSQPFSDAVIGCALGKSIGGANILYYSFDAAHNYNSILATLS